MLVSFTWCVFTWSVLLPNAPLFQIHYRERKPKLSAVWRYSRSSRQCSLFLHLLVLRTTDLFEIEYTRPGPEVIKLFPCSTQLSMKIFSANKYENANYCWHFIFISRGIFMLSYVQQERICQFTSLFNKSQVYNICKQQENNIVHTKHMQHLQYCGTETYIKILTLEQYLGDGHQYNRSLIFFFFFFFFFFLICIRPLWPKVLEYKWYIQHNKFRKFRKFYNCQ